MDDAFSQEIFSQYDDNFALASLENIEANKNSSDVPVNDSIESKDLNKNHDKVQKDKSNHVVSATGRFVPTFGKKKKANISRQADVQKQKNLIPPPEIQTWKKNSEKHVQNVENHNENIKNYRRSYFNGEDGHLLKTGNIESMEITACDNSNLVQNNNENLNTIEIQEHKENNLEDSNIESYKTAVISNVVHQNPAAEMISSNQIEKQNNSLGNIIFGSLNLINDDEEMTEYQVLSQKSKESDNTNVKELTRELSKVSVTSLNKVYKNLDMKSYENINNILNKEISSSNANEEPNSVENSVKERTIPIGDEFLKLFQNIPTKKLKKPIAMCIAFGDMGFNKNYSEYIKNSKHISITDDIAQEARTKILQAYPKENEKYLQVVKKRKLN